MRPYVIWTPPYNATSGGVSVLHHLCHKLNKRCMRAYIETKQWGDYEANPAWDTPKYAGEVDPIVVYPEITPGNPFGATTVARWVLNTLPPRDFDEKELLFPFIRLYNLWNLPAERILFLPDLDLSMYFRDGRPKSGRLVYYGNKGDRAAEVTETKGLPEIGVHPDMDRADSLRGAELLYTYDNRTALTDAARLCGCPVVIIPDGTMTRAHLDAMETGPDGVGLGVAETERAMTTLNAHAFRAHYLDLIDLFDQRLDTFIEVTQHG